jgi:hypothetical protein
VSLCSTVAEINFCELPMWCFLSSLTTCEVFFFLHSRGGGSRPLPKFWHSLTPELQSCSKLMMPQLHLHPEKCTPASAGKNAIQPKLLIASLCSRILHQTKFLSHIPWTRETPHKPTSPTITHHCSFIPFLSTSLPTLTALLPLSHQPHHSACSSIDIFVTHSTDTHKPTSPTIAYPLEVLLTTFLLLLNSRPSPSLVACHLYAHPTRYERAKILSRIIPMQTH